MLEFLDVLADVDATGSRADETIRAALALLIALRVCRIRESAVDASQTKYLRHWQALLNRALAAAARNDPAVADEVLQRLAPIRQADLAGDPGFPGADLDEDFAAAAFYALDVFAAGNAASLHHAATRLLGAADLASDGDERNDVFQRELTILRDLVELARAARSPETLVTSGRAIIEA